VTSQRDRDGQESLEQFIDRRLENVGDMSRGGQLFAEVVTIIQAVLERVQTQVSAKERRIAEELETLADVIERAKEDVESVRPHDIRSHHLPLANGELGAIASHLEEATGTILDTCEELEKLAETLPGEASEKLLEYVTRIYEACNFHDITGQRIKKVTDTLEAVERRIDALLSALGDPPPEEPAEKTKTKKELSDEDLLNGPALPGTGTTQDEIDALFG